jgi:hypothetical protein
MIAMSKQCRLVIAWAVLIASGLWILVLGIYIIEWLNEWVGGDSENEKNGFLKWFPKL